VRVVAVGAAEHHRFQLLKADLQAANNFLLAACSGCVSAALRSCGKTAPDTDTLRAAMVAVHAAGGRQGPQDQAKAAVGAFLA
jgi:hypothetical protein